MSVVMYLSVATPISGPFPKSVVYDGNFRPQGGTLEDDYNRYAIKANDDGLVKTTSRFRISVEFSGLAGTRTLRNPIEMVRFCKEKADEVWGRAACSRTED